VTFRHPGTFAKVVTTVDEMSGGRIEVGVGAGWNDLEHRQLGLPFPPLDERADILEDQLAILHGLWGEPDGWSHRGKTLTLEDSQFYPKPVQVPGRPVTSIGSVRPRIILGGGGKPRPARLAARYADEYNIVSARPDEATRIYGNIADACRAIGRDPGEITRSAMAGVLVGRNESEVRDRQAALMKAFGDDADEGEAWLEERRTRWIFGTPDEARATVRRFADAGVERMMLQDFLPWDLDMVDVMGEELVGRV
jgi:alkanesulfonate monooxygenase SsuD/methylene tetrahydromethanopterin reductase-like flavin-dependent oxidoreductase (luciferase family)